MDCRLEMRKRVQSLLYGCMIAGILVPSAFSQWVEKSAEGWIQVALYHHNTTTRFDEQGNNESLFNEGGRSITTSVFLTGVVGVVAGVDVWVQTPFHRLEFNDVVENRRSTGFGDPRVHVRIDPFTLAGSSAPFPMALRGGVKLKGQEFPVDSEIIPLTEGQRDWELILELGHSFYPRPIYAMAWIGYRWRESNTEIRKDPGNELFYLASLGGSINGWTWKFSIEGLAGEPSRFFNIKIESSKRKFFQILPTVGHGLGPGTFEFGGRFPVSGRNLPSGPAVFVGYFFRFGL